MKKRLDILVTERGLAESREKAKTLIMAGQVYVDGQKADKPGDTFSEDAAVEVRGKGLPYVSRGGLKLEKAMREFGLQLQGRTCMDIGASTGGFTDCMLQNGAQRVYSVDVGYGQLAWSLRTDPRVVNLERTNARYLTREQVPEEIGFMTSMRASATRCACPPESWAGRCFSSPSSCSISIISRRRCWRTALSFSPCRPHRMFFSTVMCGNRA